jgi:hypothetical protein
MLLNIEKQHASISNVNFRKENHGKQHVLAADVKFSMELPVSRLNDLAIDKPPISFDEFFYDHKIENNEDIEGGTISRKREFGISNISLNIELFEHEISIQSDGENMPPVEFSQVKINSFSVEFQQNRMMKLSARLQFEMPNDDEIIGRLAEFIKAQVKMTIEPPAQQDFVDNAENDIDHEDDDIEGVGTSDPAYEQAKELVINSQRVTISFLQRELKIGYNRSAGLIDTLEAEGIIGPHKDNAPRDVLIHPGVEAIAEAESS